jgi:hypothetical protein
MADLPALTQASTLTYGALRGDRNHRVWIAGAIRSLLRLYWSAEDSERLDEAAGKWWADDLEAFSKPVIEAAINDWRRGQTKRPTPADMIQLCGRHMPKSRPTLVQMPEREPITPEGKARIEAMVGRAFPELKRMPRSGDE